MMRIGQDTESTPKKASAADVSGLVDLLRGKTKQMRQPGAKPRTDNADEELKDAGTIKMFKVAPEPADQTPKGFGSQIEEHARRYFERPGRKLKRFLDSVEKEIEKSRRIRENVQAAEIWPVPDMQPGLPDRSFGNPFAPRAAEGSIGEISTKGIIFGNGPGSKYKVSTPQKWSSESPRLQSDLDRIKLNLQEKGRKIGIGHEEESHHLHALHAAIQIFQAVEDLCRVLAIKEGEHTLKVFSAIDTGPSLVGCIGGPSRKKFTAIGVPVIRAFRLKGKKKDAHSALLISDRVRERIPVEVQNEFEYGEQQAFQPDTLDDPIAYAPFCAGVIRTIWRTTLIS